MSARNSSSLRLTSSGWSRVTQCEASSIPCEEEPSFSSTFSAHRLAWNVCVLMAWAAVFGHE